MLCARLALFAAVGCAPAADPEEVLDLFGDVVRSIQLAEIEAGIWQDEVVPVWESEIGESLREDAELSRRFHEPRPTAEEIAAIRTRCELAVSALPRKSHAELRELLRIEGERADAAVGAYRGTRRTILREAERLASS